MTSRSAVSTIIGYFYQFDLSILSILELENDEDVVDLECIEDVDICSADETTAIQCKYYEKSEYNHSVIKPAIVYMLDHYGSSGASDTSKINYVLKGYFRSGQEKFPDQLDLVFLKEHFLSWTENGKMRQKHSELGLSDDDLKEFLSKLTIDVNAPRMEDQLNDVMKKFAEIFECTPFSAEYYYYVSALGVIKELSTSHDASRRRISKKDFLRRIDTSKVLFDEWFVRQKGRAKYFNNLRNEYFSSLNLSYSERLFVIHIDSTVYSRSELKDVLNEIFRKYSKISKRSLQNFSPSVLILGLDEGELVAVKQDLHNEGVSFVDGYDFKGAVFDPNSFLRDAKFEIGPVLRFFNSLDDAIKAFETTKVSRKVFEFFVESPVVDLADSSVGKVEIQLPDFREIKHII